MCFVCSNASFIYSVYGHTVRYEFVVITLRYGICLTHTYNKAMPVEPTFYLYYVNSKILINCRVYLKMTCDSPTDALV